MRMTAGWDKSKALTATQVEDIQTLLNDIDGAELRSYSGRNMYGKQCLGIDMDGIQDAFRFALMVTDDDLCLALSSPVFDDMGRGIIVYFPDVEAPEGIDNEADDDGDAPAPSVRARLHGRGGQFAGGGRQPRAPSHQSHHTNRH